MTTSQHSRVLPTWVTTVLYAIAVIQLGLGLAFLVAPAGTAGLLDLAAAPAWTGWLFAMMAARFLGYGVGVLAAARRPAEHLLWLRTMLVIQAVDWVATLAYLGRGDVTLGQVTTAAFLPPLFIAALAVAIRRVGVDGTPQPQHELVA